MYIYHITHPNIWKTAELSGYFEPPTFSNDGFIHCSTSSQVSLVANHYYRNQPNLLLIQIDTAKVRATVIYENLEGGTEMFPHIYGRLNLDSVVSLIPFSTSPEELLPSTLD